MKNTEVIVCGLNNIDNVLQALKRLIHNKNIIILLCGDLASGKTTFVKKYVELLGYEDLVTSPTFSLQSVYGNNIFHYDLYNKTINEFISLGMLEEFEKDGLHFVEWGEQELENILDEHGFAHINIKINKLNGLREYTIET